MTLPIMPAFKRYRGAKPALQKKTAEHNRQAQRVADYLNRQIAANPAEIQQYYFKMIGLELEIPFEVVRSAISTGGANGITLRITTEDRPAYAKYLR